MLLVSLGAFLAVRLLRPPPSNAPSVEDQLKQVLPNADPLLVHRAAETWGQVAIQAAEQHQEPGLKVLEAFEDEAAYCLQHDANAFAAMVRVIRLDPERFRLASGPWNRAVLDWAQSGKLEQFLDRLEGMQPGSLATAETIPAALPLLCAENTPTAHAMLEKYGDRAWQLFMMVNFTEHPEDLERVAQAVSDCGDLILDVNEEYGLPFALLLVPPATDKGSQQFPTIAKYVLNKFTERPTALAFLTVNYSTFTELLDGEKSSGPDRRDRRLPCPANRCAATRLGPYQHAAPADGKLAGTTTGQGRPLPLWPGCG